MMSAKQDSNEIRIDTNFPGGAVEGVMFGEDGAISFSAPKNGSPRSLWYYFRITGGRGKKLCFYQKELEDVLGLFEARTYAFTAPVVKFGEEGQWQRIPVKDIKFESDPIEYTFSFVQKEDIAYVAFSYPYTFKDLVRYIGINRKKEYIALDYIGETAEGRKYPCLKVGPVGNNIEGMVIITARHHAGEVSGSYVLEGIINAYISLLEELGPEKVGASLLIFPFVDLDGVETGRYGKDRPPVDFNRDWTVYPQHSEIRWIQNHTEKEAAKNTPILYIDLHAPQPGGTTYIVPARASSSKPDHYYMVWDFYGKFEKAIEGTSTCRVQDLDPYAINWGQEMYQHNSVQYHAKYFSIPSFTLETSYHYDSENALLEPDMWRKIGEKFWETCITVFKDSRDHEKSSAELYNKNTDVEKNIRITSGEIVWKNWEMVSLPENVVLEEEGDGLNIFSSEGGNVFITCRRYIQRKEKLSVKASYSTEGSRGLDIEIRTYFYKKNIVFEGFTRQWFLIQPGIHTFYSLEDENCNGYDVYRISVKIKNLRGQVRLEIGE